MLCYVTLRRHPGPDHHEGNPENLPMEQEVHIIPKGSQTLGSQVSKYMKERFLCCTHHITMESEHTGMCSITDRARKIQVPISAVPLCVYVSDLDWAQTLPEPLTL